MSNLLYDPFHFVVSEVVITGVFGWLDHARDVSLNLLVDDAPMNHGSMITTKIFSSLDFHMLLARG